MREDRAGDYRVDDLAAGTGRIRGLEDSFLDVVPVDAGVRVETGRGIPVARGQHGRVGLRFGNHAGIREGRKAGTSGSGFVESSLGNFPFTTGRSLVVYGDGIARRVVDISPDRVSNDRGVDTAGNLWIARARASAC